MASTTVPQWDPSLDALTAAPNHHWVLLENDSVRARFWDGFNAFVAKYT